MRRGSKGETSIMTTREVQKRIARELGIRFRKHPLLINRLINQYYLLFEWGPTKTKRGGNGGVTVEWNPVAWYGKGGGGEGR